ncbi:hypothetical protein J1605_009217 [Eschrichtius robustus]|uniref:E3 SUMO-protein ligase RNF212 n=1 Tax=Eschrichtius robustus TaxID=9764 RepID=A0AB34GSM4_ESCRO|nr:hypothetical protein J1605_009217 [Eschrichtius robustus]
MEDQGWCWFQVLLALDVQSRSLGSWNGMALSVCLVSEFQEKHRRRLIAFYREKISQLEESLRKSALRMEQLQSGDPPAPVRGLPPPCCIGQLRAAWAPRGHQPESELGACQCGLSLVWGEKASTHPPSRWGMSCWCRL